MEVHIKFFTCDPGGTRTRTTHIKSVVHKPIMLQDLRFLAGKNGYAPLTSE